MRGVGESTKGKIKALDLYVCLLLHASLVQVKHACAKKRYTSSFLAAVGYNARKKRFLNYTKTDFKQSKN